MVALIHANLNATNLWSFGSCVPLHVQALPLFNGFMENSRPVFTCLHPVCCVSRSYTSGVFLTDLHRWEYEVNSTVSKGRNLCRGGSISTPSYSQQGRSRRDRRTNVLTRSHHSLLNIDPVPSSVLSLFTFESFLLFHHPAPYSPGRFYIGCPFISKAFLRPFLGREARVLAQTVFKRPHDLRLSTQSRRHPIHYVHICYYFDRGSASVIGRPCPVSTVWRHWLVRLD